MAYWIYKCNSKFLPYQSAGGDWNDFFEAKRPRVWGSTEWSPEIGQIAVGDTMLCYQTDRNELVGLAEVAELRKRRGYLDLILKQGEEIRAKIRPLKVKFEDVADIPALRQGPVQTFYPITAADVRILLGAAGFSRLMPKGPSRTSGSPEAATGKGGGGFGDPEVNPKVELAAMRFATRHLSKHGWTVVDVSAQKCGYDLECRKGRRSLHVEVKGTKGQEPKFILTRGEAETWKQDKDYCLVVVLDALSDPRIEEFRGPSSFAKFKRTPISYLCTLAGSKA